MPQIPFVGAAYRERSTNFDAQMCINFFPVVSGSALAKSVKALYGTPGTRPFTTVGTGPIRGFHRLTDNSGAIVVSGAAAYRMTPAGTLTNLGVIAGTGPVGIADNGQQAIIVIGPTGYSIDLTANTLSHIVASGFYGATSVDILDNYTLLNRPGTRQWYISAASDVTQYDPLDFASAESNFEPIVRLFVNHDEILLFKTTVTEVWRASGDPSFPFARDTNAAITHGCAAPWSVVELDNTVVWLGTTEEGGMAVWRLNGYTPVRVSTDAIDYAIAQYGDISDAIAYSYMQEGHAFYMLTFPTANVTWCYDAATQQWHQRAYLDPATGRLGRHRSNNHIYLANMHIVGDYSTGELYVLDLDWFCDRASDPMPAIRAAAYVASADLGFIAHRRLQLDMETGVGLVSGQGSDPVVWLDWSDDGGKTWGSQESASMGALGNNRVRVRWNRLGRALARVYRITISDPVKRIVLGAVLNPEA